MLMTAATVVQVLQDFVKFYCMFYFTCDLSLTETQSDTEKIDISKTHRAY